MPVNRASTASSRLPPRVEAWVEGRNYVAIGNLGEHVAAGLLADLGYQLLAGQDDLLGGGGLDDQPNAHAEDLVAITPDGRLTTVNAKAATGLRSCRLTRVGHLTAPRLGRGQSLIDYYSPRAGMFQELEGEAFGMVVKVDLRHLAAQLFDLNEAGRLVRNGPVHEVAALVDQVLRQFPGAVPPPTAMDYS